MITKIICFLTKLIAGYTVRSKGFDQSQKQYIFYANHSSHLDFLVIWSALPEEIRNKTRPVAAADYWLNSNLKKYLVEKVFNAVLIDRKNQDEDSLGIIGEALSQGDSIIIFPEGTRSLSGEIIDFKSGLYHLVSANPEAACIPVYLENLNRILPKGEYLPVPILSSVTLGSEIKLADSESKSEFLEKAKDKLIQLNTN